MRKGIKIFVGLVFSLLLAAVFVPLAMSVPAVQNAVGRRLMARFSDRLGTTVKFDRIEIRRLNRVVVEGFFVADLQGDTLLYVPRVEAPVEQLPLWGRDMVFGRVTLAGARMRIDRDSLGQVNIRQIVRRIPDGKGAANVYINGIEARGIDFALTRHDHAPRAFGVDFGRFFIAKTDVDISRLAVEGSELRIGIERLAFVESTGWRVDRLKGELLVGRGVVALDDLEIDSDGSRLRLPRIALEGSRWRSFGSFADSVRVTVEMADSRLTARLVGRFLPLEIDETVEDLSASFGGVLSALTGRIDRARAGGTELVGLEFSSRGLPAFGQAEFAGRVARLVSTDAERFHAPLKGFDFAGEFAGSLDKGVEVAGRLGVAEVRYGDFGAAAGEFDVKARLGREPTVKAAGSVRGAAFRTKQLGSAEVDGEFSAGRFSVSAEAPNPGAEWGVNGALSARADGTPRDFEARAELRDVLYISPKGSVATPLIELAARVAPDEKTATITSEIADARARLVNGELTGEATLKAADELLALFAPGLQAASGARIEGRLDTRTKAAELRFLAEMVDYRGVLLAEPRLEGRRDGTVKASLTAKDLYAGALHIPAPRLDAEMDERRTRLTLDGANYLTVSGLTTAGAADSLHVDLAGFDLAALGGLTPKGTRVDGYADIVGRRVTAEVGAKNIDAALLQPFVDGVVSDTRGLASVDLRVDGEPRSLRVDGALDVVNLSATLAATGARYHVDHAVVTVRDSRATLPPTPIRDRFGGTGSLSAQVDLAAARTSLEATADGLLAFDKSSTGSFGGRVFASGSVRVASERMGTTLSIDARTDPGTVLRLPLSGRAGAERTDFVSFAAPAQTPEPETEMERRIHTRTRRPSRADAQTSLEMNVRVTDAAEVHLTLDPRLGRGITARGEGVISLGVDPRSRQMAVTGDYTIGEGRMELSMMDVLSKNFTIAPGSTIRWSGAPGDAALDVRALYRVRTSLSPLLGTGMSERANVPVDCVLSLAGRLDEPAVTFDVELPSADTDQRLIAAEAMNTDELKSMQFLSLLVTGNFAGAGSIGAGTGASTEALASGSVGFDILTSQLGALLSSDAYDVFFRYRPEDNFLTNRVDMGFSAGFARDRLRLQIEGNYVDDREAVSLGTQRGMGNLAGDVSLTWVIDEAGNLRLKVFSQTIDRLNETQGLQESGLGIYYRKDFDRLSDIFQRK